MHPKHCTEVSPQCPAGQEDGYRLGWYQGQVAACDDYHGTPCEQIRHRQEIDRLRGLIKKASEVAGMGRKQEACEILHAEVYPEIDSADPE